MGVKGLWTLLGPYADRKSLYEIRGERIAIDLSGWVCDSQNVADHHAQPRLYLRNLFFRANYLLTGDITPIFVLEGEAPLAKQATMANRNLIQYKDRPRAPGKKLKKPDRKRKQFNSVLLNCEKLLNSMGLECIRGNGEAEAMCAHLNSTGVVSAVISQDSDCFVYGATRVYRNFSVSNSGANSANHGSVDVYDIDNIKKSLNFGRKKMVALALLCGSDYNGNGVEGVGYSHAIGFLTQHSEETILETLASWTNDSKKYENLMKTIDNPAICSGCGHNGNIRSHTRLGCLACKTNLGCDQSIYRDQRQNLKMEINIRNKALQSSEPFPNADLIDEFLLDKEETPKDFKAKWAKPDLIKFIKLMMKMLGWTECYCVEKFLPLMTKWQLLHKGGVGVKENISLLIGSDDKSWITPRFIKKKRTPKGVPCYEVVWADANKYYENLIPDDQFVDVTEEDVWTTVERQDLMEAAYPEVVEEFLASKKNKKKLKKDKNTHAVVNANIANKEVDQILHEDLDMAHLNASLKNLSINTSKNQIEKKTRKRKGAAGEISFKTKPKKHRNKKSDNNFNPKQKRIDSFLKKPTQYNLNDGNNYQLINKTVEKLKHQKSITNISQQTENTLNMLDAIDCNTTDEQISDGDISNIIDDILKRNNDTDVKKYFKNDENTPIKNAYNFSTPVKSYSIQRIKHIYDFENDCCSTPVTSNKRRVSYFFGGLDDNEDAFEATMDLKNIPDEKRSRKNSRHSIHRNDSNDSFKNCTPVKSRSSYTSLMDRIRKLNELYNI